VHSVTHVAPETSNFTNFGIFGAPVHPLTNQGEYGMQQWINSGLCSAMPNFIFLGTSCYPRGTNNPTFHYCYYYSTTVLWSFVWNKFCYLGDMLSMAGDADAAVEAIYHWLGEAGCTAVVCEVVCYMEVRPGLLGKTRRPASADRTARRQLQASVFMTYNGSEFAVFRLY